MTNLPGDLVPDLEEILRPRRLTDDLLDEVERALGGYGGRYCGASGRAEQSQRMDAVRRLITAAKTLQREMRRADAAFPFKGPRFLPTTAWAPLAKPLQTTIDKLNGWRALWSSEVETRRGNPHHGHADFRVRVLSALQAAGLRITNPKGQAARVLARLLEELDRLDGVPPRERSEFSGSQWARWVEEVRMTDAMIADHTRTGLSIDAWARTRYPVFAREWAATRKATTRKRG